MEGLVVMGMRNSAYWLSAFLTDWSQYILVAIATFICVGAFDIAYSGEAYGSFVLIVLLNQVCFFLMSIV